MDQIKFKVISDSMQPIIQIGDELEITYEFKKCRIFDIILFKRNNSLVVHFVWRNQILYNNTLITRSMKNFYLDEAPILEKDFIGYVTNYKISLYVKFKIIALNILKRKL